MPSSFFDACHWRHPGVIFRGDDALPPIASVRFAREKTGRVCRLMYLMHAGSYELYRTILNRWAAAIGPALPTWGLQQVVYYLGAPVEY